MKKLLCLIFLSLSSIARAELSLQFKPAVGANFKQEMRNVLPAKIGELLNKKISVEFIEMDSYQELQSPCRVKSIHQVFGKTEHGKIFINRNFLPFLETEGETYPCGHGNSHKLLLATLIHELGHLLDHELQSISSAPLYEALAHGAHRAIKNHDASHVPDAYELTNTSEHFAVNLEYFLLDESYACRRPNLSSFFAQVFSAPKNCEVNFKVNGHDFHPDNVKSIHYLVADKGEQMMSRFGHAMYRIILNDGQDVVVGFSGEMNDTVINGLKGLTGKYASRLMISDFKNVREDYTKGQWRGLKSYPLNMTEEEKTRFILEVLVLRWEYSGKYYFFTNNCASEALSLVQVAYHKDKLLKASVLIPSSIKALLEEENLIDNHNIQIFPSYLATMNKLFQKVTFTTPVKFEDYIKMDSRRRNSFWKNQYERKEIFALLSLEISFQNNISKRLEGSVMKALNDLKDDHPMKRKAREAVSVSNSLTFGQRLGSGYGIPLAKEISEPQTTPEEQNLSRLMNEIFQWAAGEENPLRTEWNSSEMNINRLREMLK